jgi:catechol 2,3-dioxygenase-like lactoylglutathione lyase family enzyme
MRENLMRRAIIGYDRDDEQHWVALLACGHRQHVRHNPPFVERPWVVTEARRAGMLGYPLDCQTCETECQMSSPQIDHIVITVANLDAAARTYEALGFTLTPRAEHPWGTANRLVQFEDQNFLEILEVDRPHLLHPHDPARSPPTFSFGAFNREFLSAGLQGFAMLVLAGQDSSADVSRFTAAGLTTYQPFDFERQATLPDGGKVRVAFSLAFASDGLTPRAAFFTCHNKFPENFWKPSFQTHRNGAAGVREAVMVAAEPKSLAAFVAGYTGSPAQRIDGGIAAACGPHALAVLTPTAFARRFEGAVIDLSSGPRLAAIVIGTHLGLQGERRQITRARDAGGVLIAWQAA